MKEKIITLKRNNITPNKIYEFDYSDSTIEIIVTCTPSNMVTSDEGNSKNIIYCPYQNTRNNHDWLTNAPIDSEGTRYSSLILSPENTKINNKNKNNSDSIYHDSSVEEKITNNTTKIVLQETFRNSNYRTKVKICLSQKTHCTARNNSYSN